MSYQTSAAALTRNAKFLSVSFLMPAIACHLAMLLPWAFAVFHPQGAAGKELDLHRIALWSTGFTKGIYSMLLQEDRLYVYHQADGLLIVDVNRPEAPRTLGVYNSSGSATGVAVVGNTAYLGDGPQGLAILDISDPTHAVGPVQDRLSNPSVGRP